MLSFFKSKLFLVKFSSLIIVIALAIFFRVFLLDRIPTGISYDELVYVINSKSVFLTGKDIGGTSSPIAFDNKANDFQQTQFPALLAMPIIGPFPFSLFNARLPFALMGVMLVGVIYLISRKFTDEKTAIITATLAATNPWLVFFSRNAIDSPVAALFYFLAFYSLLVLKEWKILLSFPLFFIALHSYIGTRIIFIPFVVLTSLFAWFFVNKKKYTKFYVILSVLCFFSLGLYIFLTLQQPHNRFAEILTPSNHAVIDDVMNQRRLVIENPFEIFFSNKLNSYSKIFIDKYMGAFSLQYLFINGEARSTFSLWYHGPFYILDLIFLMVGLYFIFKEKRQWAILLVLIALLAPIPSALSTVSNSYSIRSAILFPALILIMGYGISRTIFVNKGKTSKLLMLLIIAAYSWQVFQFGYIYFLRNPIYNSDAFDLSTRNVMQYIIRANGYNEKINFVSLSQHNEIENYIFYSNAYNKESSTKIANLIKTKNFQINNVVFSTINACSAKNFGKGEVVIIPAGIECPGIDSQKYLSIAKLSDGGTVYKIYNDTLCSKYKLNRFPNRITMDKLEVNHLSEENFCKTFITSLQD